MNVITIDGLSGTGKTARAKDLANALGYNYFSIGYIFRAIAFMIVKEGSISALSSMKLSWPSKNPVHPFTVEIKNKDVTDLLHGNQQIDEICTKLAVDLKILELVKRILSKYTKKGSWVIEGRSAAEFFPNASINFYLYCSYEERIKRVRDEMFRKGLNYKEAMKIAEKSIKRNNIDLFSSVKPLRIYKSSIMIDSTKLSPNETHRQILNFCKNKLYNLEYKVTIILYSENIKQIEKQIDALSKYKKSIAKIIIPSKIINDIKIKYGYFKENIVKDKNFFKLCDKKNFDNNFFGNFFLWVKPEIEINKLLFNYHKVYHEQTNNALVLNQYNLLEPFTCPERNINDINLNNWIALSVRVEYGYMLNNMIRYGSIRPTSELKICHMSGLENCHRDKYLYSEKKLQENINSLLTSFLFYNKIIIININSLLEQNVIIDKIQESYYKKNYKVAFLLVVSRKLVYKKVGLMIQVLLKNIPIGCITPEIWLQVKKDLIQKCHENSILYETVSYG